MPSRTSLTAERPGRMLIATGNLHKAKEFREMLGGEGIQWDDLAAHRDVQEVPETGTTFAENAQLKAVGYARQFNTWAVADDSGLEVDALSGNPGVFSARWAQMHQAGKGDADNNALLLKQIANVPDEKRTGRFVCALCLADPAGRVVLTTHGAVEGMILRAPRGSNGFGYDPLFLISSRGLTTAELPSAEKHAISHRGNALRVLRTLMFESGLA